MTAAGDLIGPYRLLAQLGKGAMGEVWRARDERLDRQVALKVVPAELASDPERRARMLREAKAAAAIRHANVVTLYDVIEHDGSDILVMELVDGRTVSDMLRKQGPPDLTTGLSWIAQIADALAAAHARRILHRDIKAANVMVTSDGAIKVLDFGLAKQHDSISAGGSLVSMRPAEPSTEPAAIALDATMPSGDGSTATATATTIYQTGDGALLGTPLYMAPEQIGGGEPGARSEVFSVGVLAYEILTGSVPYTATTMDALFQQILDAKPPPTPKLPERVGAVLQRALAKEPKARFQTMRALRDAVTAQHRRLAEGRPRTRSIALAAAVLVLAAAALAWWWRANRHRDRPGDTYVERALEEYDLFYNDKALSSLRAALRLAPLHPRANAYVLLFGGAPAADRDAALAAAKRALPTVTERGKDRALLAAAIAYAERGAAAARDALTAAGVDHDHNRELAFWTAELDFRAGRYDVARDEYAALLADPAKLFRGRIYDHDSGVLLYLDDPAEALRVGTLYRDAFPGEADAIGVYATTLAAAGRLDDAIAAAEDALRLNEGEDSLAGLAKVLALKAVATKSDDAFARALALYQQSLERAGTSRRPLRRAALGLLQWMHGDAAAATATLAPCLTGGSEATVHERGACLFVAGLVDPAHADAIAAQLDELAAEATPTSPAYGAPASLARLVRARAKFFGGGCIAAPETLTGAVEEDAYTAPLDFYAAYHVPFFATYALCEHAALLASKGDRAGAAALLEPAAKRAPNRTWLLAALARLQ